MVFDLLLLLLFNSIVIIIIVFIMKVGDFQEVMYFATKTPQERQEWMEAFRQGIISIINNSLRAANGILYPSTNIT